VQWEGKGRWSPDRANQIEEMAIKIGVIGGKRVERCTQMEYMHLVNESFFICHLFVMLVCCRCKYTTENSTVCPKSYVTGSSTVNILLV
jgi:hypothetical protein